MLIFDFILAGFNPGQAKFWYKMIMASSRESVERPAEQYAFLRIAHDTKYLKKMERKYNGSTNISLGQTA